MLASPGRTRRDARRRLAGGAASSCGRAVIDDWYDNGRVDGTYALHCYDDAIDDAAARRARLLEREGRHPARAPGAQARRASTACLDRPDPAAVARRRRTLEDPSETSTTETTGSASAGGPDDPPNEAGGAIDAEPTAPAPFRSRS